MPPEEPKRLDPTKDTVRDLFAFSGNQCAYPGCKNVLIDPDTRDFVGQVCHIESAMPGGERFNAAMTNEQRRAPANLLLMCYADHVRTNNEANYSVERMREFKADHEKQFWAAVDAIRVAPFSDATKSMEASSPTTLQRMNKALGWGNSQEELAGTIETLEPLIEALGRVPEKTRSLLAIIVDRGTSLHLSELQHVTQEDTMTIVEHLRILQKYGIAGIFFEDEPDPVAETYELDGWPFWRDVKAFCAAEEIDIKEIAVRMRFDLFD